MQSIRAQNAVIQWRKQNNGDILLKSSGDWTLDTLKDTANTLDEISQTNRNVHIRWEVADIGRIDSAGMMLFIRSYNMLKANNCTIEITGANFVNLILELREILGLTVVMVTHDLDSIWTIVDRFVVLGEHKVIAEGTFKEVIKNPHPIVRQFFCGARGRIRSRDGK